jgi:hypothetical protein
MGERSEVPAGPTLGVEVEVEVVRAATAGEIERFFAGLSQSPTSGLVINPDPFFINQREQLVALAIRHAVPALSPLREHRCFAQVLNERQRQAAFLELSQRPRGSRCAAEPLGAARAAGPALLETALVLVRLRHLQWRYTTCDW